MEVIFKYERRIDNYIDTCFCCLLSDGFLQIICIAKWSRDGVNYFTTSFSTKCFVGFITNKMYTNIRFY